MKFNCGSVTMRFNEGGPKEGEKLGNLKQESWEVLEKIEKSWGLLGDLPPFEGGSVRPGPAVFLHPPTHLELAPCGLHYLVFGVP